MKGYPQILDKKNSKVSYYLWAWVSLYNLDDQCPNRKKRKNEKSNCHESIAFPA